MEAANPSLTTGSLFIVSTKIKVCQQMRNKDPFDSKIRPTPPSIKTKTKEVRRKN